MGIGNNASYIARIENHEKRLALSKADKVKEIDFEALKERCVASKQRCYNENTDKGRALRAKVLSKKLTRYF